MTATRRPSRPPGRDLERDAGHRRAPTDGAGVRSGGRSRGRRARRREPQQVKHDAGRRAEQPDAAVGIVRPPDWNLGDAKPELKSDQAELGVVEIAVDPLVFREPTRHVGPEQLEPALGVSEGKSGQNPEQAVERLAEQLAERVLPCRQLGSRDRAGADDEVEAIVQNSEEFRRLDRAARTCRRR